MPEFFEGKPTFTSSLPQETTTLDLVIPKLAEIRRRGREFAIMYVKASQRVLNDDPEPLSLDQYPYKPGLRVNYADVQSGKYTNVSIMRPTPKNGEPETIQIDAHTADSIHRTYILRTKRNRFGSPSLKGEGISVQFQTDAEAADEQAEGIVTKDLQLTAKGRRGVIELLDALPDAERVHPQLQHSE